MVQKIKFRDKITAAMSDHVLLVILISILLAILIMILIAYQFKAPKSLTMTTGFENGTYANFGERYRQILAREKIKIHLLTSSGSLENLKRLKDKSFPVDVGFVQDGVTSPVGANNLVSLGAIGYAPFWVFYRSDETFNYLSDLKGKKIAIGQEGSGVRDFALALLKLNNSADPPTRLVDLSGADANKALLAEKVDAVMMIGTEDNALIRELLYSPKVRLMTFRQAEAYTRIIPALSHVVLPQGILDVSRKLPAQDVHLLAVTTNLVVRKDLHPALVYLLLDAAVEIHGNAGWLNKKGEFPAAKELSFPSSKYADRFYKSGRPFLLDYLPFGVAAFVDRTLLLMFPVILVLIPLIRSIPWVYSWRHRRKFYRWYRELKNLELEVMESSNQQDVEGYLTRIDRIESAIYRIQVPLAFFAEAYKIQEHLDLVRGKLIRLSNRCKEENVPRLDFPR